MIWDFRMEAQLWRNAALKTQNDIKPNRVFALVTNVMTPRNQRSKVPESTQPAQAATRKG
jgi:hypothetical protein